MNGSRGSGYAAEYGNITIDRLVGKDTINEAQNLDPITGRQVANGADRIVNGQAVQTKYYKEFSSLYKETFPNGHARYVYDNELMKIEVPRDKYVEFCKKLQEKIDAGEIIEIEPGTDAKSIIKKGFFSYNEACNIARAGTIEGLTVDLTNGIITSFYPATISSVIVFAMAVWKGKDIQEAAKASLETTIQVLGRSMFIYTATMQLTRSEIGISFLNISGVKNPIFTVSQTLTTKIQSSKLAGTSLGKQLGLKTITEKMLISNVVTAAVVFGPDIYKFFSGKISAKQLFKNSLVGVGGIGGGVLAGSIFGPLGMIVGGILGSMATKAVLDKYIEDDAIEMFYIYKEEYLDQVAIAHLDKEEFEQISSWTLGSEHLSKFLETMYTKLDPRSFAREYIIECIENLYSKKSHIDETMIEKGYVDYLKTGK